MKLIITSASALLACITGFVTTGDPDCFCAAVCFVVMTLAAWFAYELDLHAMASDMQLESWEIKQKQEQAFKIMMNKRVIRRELISEWEKTG